MLPRPSPNPLSCYLSLVYCVCVLSVFLQSARRRFGNIYSPNTAGQLTPPCMAPLPLPLFPLHANDFQRARCCSSGSRGGGEGLGVAGCHFSASCVLLTHILLWHLRVADRLPNEPFQSSYTPAFTLLRFSLSSSLSSVLPCLCVMMP